ncbi:unnamed protein product [Aureobasidium vineae]|uniref:SAP domain-containing protein n=1 Tax=Aureobasidium vineae TaxID=2773715 RepID=A0A9N8JTK4_9PEZI|nr:unnamed protein product [Aureobasidium vineae]
MRSVDLKSRLQARELPYSGNKAVLVQRLQDNDIFPTASSLQQEHESSRPLPEDFLDKMKSSDPRAVTRILRKLTTADLVSRNDELRRRRARDVVTSLTGSSDGTMTGASRKRRFSNLGLNWELGPEHPLTKRIRDEKTREKLERERARVQHERPSWFGTPKDPLPDFWMGRPVLLEREIDVLKGMDSIPKYYVSRQEESMIRSAQGDREEQLSDIVRRLEAELMSRNFWMQSLGFEAGGDHGNFPSSDYKLADT